MLRSARSLIAAVIALTALGACAYAPEGVEPSWTDAQLNEAPPSQSPDFISEERLSEADYLSFYANQRALGDLRDEVQAAADDVPDAPDNSEDYAERARERARPPESR